VVPILSLMRRMRICRYACRRGGSAAPEEAHTPRWNRGLPSGFGQHDYPTVAVGRKPLEPLIQPGISCRVLLSSPRARGLIRRRASSASERFRPPHSAGGEFGEDVLLHVGWRYSATRDLTMPAASFRAQPMPMSA